MTHPHTPGRLAALGLAAALGGCGDATRLPPEADTGPTPTLVEPVHSLVPTVQVAEPRPWQSGEAPTPAPGLRVQAFATGLDHPRWLQVLPNGDVLVAETNAPPRPDDGKGLKARIQKLFMKKAGAATPSANRISLLRDVDGDGRAEQREVFVQGLNSPFGMALVGDRFYVADTDAVLEFAYAAGQTRLDGPGRRLTDLPAGPINHHWTKSLIASPDGRKLYATVGSNSNVAENGIEAEQGRAAIWEIDRASGAKRLFASGLRNPNGMAWLPVPGGQAPAMLWTVANERDELGSDLVPDYLTAVHDGAFYGWPYCWYGNHVDSRVTPQRPELVARAVAPDYALGAHVAALGLAAAGSSPLPAAFRGEPGGVFIGLHGSWNRKPPSGYKVVYVAFADGRPHGRPTDVLTGFLTADGHARGRPVGVAMDGQGALLVADDVGNNVWRVSADPATASPH